MRAKRLSEADYDVGVYLTDGTALFWVARADASARTAWLEDACSPFGVVFSVSIAELIAGQYTVVVPPPDSPPVLAA